MPKYLVTYDISDNRIRNLVADKLLNMGFERISRSVFVGQTTRGRIEDLRRWLKRVLGPEDKVHIISLCDNCLRTLHEVRRDSEETIGTKFLEREKKRVTLLI